jgi:ribosomal protein L40E
MAFFEKFGEKLTNAGKDVAKKTKELADITRLNMQISSEEDNIKNKYIEIGKLYYKLFSESPDERFTQLFNSIAESKNKINFFKEQIQAIKGIKICSNCGAEIESSAKFCSACGYKSVVEENTSVVTEENQVVEDNPVVAEENQVVIEENTADGNTTQGISENNKTDNVSVIENPESNEPID